ncbi:MAG: Asp23/Gls24 family envelope stress response protein [Oscillibacter sp.]|nr:Asp23/Gls24 family envelope stress response protein [Oscillibacter sp.]
MAESKGYTILPEENGSIRISEEVIAAIAVGAAREVEGVSGMLANFSASVTDLVTSKKGAQKSTRGVKMDTTEDGALILDLYISVAYGYAIPEVAENAQKAVSAAVADMTGCKVDRVNIHVGALTLE